MSMINTINEQCKQTLGWANISNTVSDNWVGRMQRKTTPSKTCYLGRDRAMK